MESMEFGPEWFYDEYGRLGMAIGFPMMVVSISLFVFSVVLCVLAFGCKK
jgi:hypothetical protein